MICNMDCLNCYFSACWDDLDRKQKDRELLTAPDEALSKSGRKRRDSLQKKQETAEARKQERLERNREHARNYAQRKREEKQAQKQAEQMEEEQMQEEKKNEPMTEEELKQAKKKAYHAEYYQKNKARLDAKNKEAKAKRDAEKKAAADQLERIKKMKSTYGLDKKEEPAAEVEEETAEPILETAEAEPTDEGQEQAEEEAAAAATPAEEEQAEEEEMEEYVFTEKPEETEESTQREEKKLPEKVTLEMNQSEAESLYIFLQDEILRVVKRDDVDELEWVADMCDIYRELKGVLMGK